MGLFPAKLFPKGSLNEADWKDVKDISFSGGGGELTFSLDKSFYDEMGKTEGPVYDNFETDLSTTINIDSEFNVFGLEFQMGIDVGGDLGFARHSFKHSINSDDSSVGFVLTDPDSGDEFDVKIGIDKTYGSFVFKTTGGLSKCIHEIGTAPREQPSISVQKQPSGMTLPDQPAIFKGILSNAGPTSNEYDISIDRRHNEGGLKVYANGGMLNGRNQHIEILDDLESMDATISIMRGPVLYEYPAIKLILESRCEHVPPLSTSVSATYDLYTHIKKEDGKQVKVIRFAQECPKVEFENKLAEGLVVFNKAKADKSRELEIMVLNMERDVRGNLTAMVADATLTKVELLYRQIGSLDWKYRVQGSNGDLDLATSDAKEDEYGYVTAPWNLGQLQDGKYEVMAQSVCEMNPTVFKYSTSKIAILQLDTSPPEPFQFPSKTDALHVGEPLIFEYNEELDCSEPSLFTVVISVSGSSRAFNKDNTIVVCEGRMIGVQFDGSKFNLDELAGKTANITLSDVYDTSYNKGDAISTRVHFTSKLASVARSSNHAKKNSHHRRLTDVPSIKIFQKTLVPSSVSIDDNGRVEESQLKGLEERLEQQEERLATLHAQQEERLTTLHNQQEERLLAALQNVLLMIALVFFMLFAALLVWTCK